MFERKRLGFVDRAWLRMDSPHNPMVITAVLFFAEGLPWEALVDVVERLAKQPRFASRVVPAGPLWAAWEPVERFEPLAHVERVTVPPDEEALRVLVARVVSTPLPRTAPLWRMVVADRGAAGVALIVRVHHAVGDGVTLLRTLLDVAERHEGARAVAGTLLPEVPRALRQRLARVEDDARALVRLLALSHEPPSPLRPRLTGRKDLAWTPPLPLPALSSRAHARKATLTDLVMAAFSMALDEEHRRCTGQPLPSARALVPVFVHGAAANSGNHFGLVFLPLPQADTLDERIAELSSTLPALKDAPDTEVALLVLGGLGLLPRLLERAGVALFTGKASLLFTSVPGARGTVTLGGHRLARLVVSAPVAGTIGMSVSLLSHGDDVEVSVALDRALPHDPRRIVTRLAELLT
ncbi:MAG: DUF1298 domain-containing protein [Myxococcaceae bacterium]|nr:DUF1298 domain-containing protein [Myxococcaceae bacterium]